MVVGREQVTSAGNGEAAIVTGKWSGPELGRVLTEFSLFAGSKSITGGCGLGWSQVSEVDFVPGVTTGRSGMVVRVTSGPFSGHTELGIVSVIGR